MKLNEEGKQQVRDSICRDLKGLSSDKKIKFDKDLLEELLFFRVKYDTDKYLKLPVWSGEFLEKLDLSEVDFSDVSYSMLFDVYTDKSNSQFDDIYKLINEKVPNNYIKSAIYYVNTNANIDFKKSFEYKRNGVIRIHGCNFTGTNLSNNEIDDTFDIIHGYFYGSNLKISTIRNNSSAQSSDFTGVNLSYYDVDVQKVLNSSYPFHNSIVRNTGINIFSVSRDMECLDEFLSQYYAGRFDGCFVNGVYIKSQEELSKSKEGLRRNYASEKIELFTRIKKIIRN